MSDTLHKIHKLAKKLAAEDIVIRSEKDDSHFNLESWKDPSKIYRGMSAKEYDTTVGKKKDTESKNDEGTYFTESPRKAELFGSRKSNGVYYVVEYKKPDDLEKKDEDWITNSVPFKNVTRAWKFTDSDGKVVASQVI